MGSSPKRKGRTSWQKPVLAVLCVLLSLVLIFLICATVYAEHALNMIKREEKETFSAQVDLTFPPEETKAPGDTRPVLEPSDVTLNTDDADIMTEDILNILLIGQDRRANENYKTRSDAMILCSFNTEENTVTLTSFLRDMYVDLPGRGGDKLNAAYAYGGMELLTDTLKTNFGVSVDACVEVDFSGFQQVVDTVGGVDIALTQKEAEYMKKVFGWDLREGDNHMDGKMALAYSRIRAIGNDFGRTQRQRKVLMQLLENSRELSFTGTVALLGQVLPLLTTNMTDGQILATAKQLFPMLGSCSVKTLRIPADGTYQDAWVNGQMVLVPDLEKNRAILKEALQP